MQIISPVARRERVGCIVPRWTAASAACVQGTPFRCLPEAAAPWKAGYEAVYFDRQLDLRPYIQRGGIFGNDQDTLVVSLGRGCAKRSPWRSAGSAYVAPGGGLARGPTSSSTGVFGRWRGYACAWVSLALASTAGPTPGCLAFNWTTPTPPDRG